MLYIKAALALRTAELGVLSHSQTMQNSRSLLTFNTMHILALTQTDTYSSFFSNIITLPVREISKLSFISF